MLLDICFLLLTTKWFTCVSFNGEVAFNAVGFRILDPLGRFFAPLAGFRSSAYRMLPLCNTGYFA